VNPHLNAEHIAAPTRLRREYSSSNSEPSTHGIKLKSGNVRHAAVIRRQAEIAPTVLERLARPNAAQWGTDIRLRNRKRSDGAAAVLRSIAAAVCVLAT
jgi:hypothetical protein